LFSVALALSGIVGAALSKYIALEKGQVLTQEIIQNVYGSYFSTLTIWAFVLVGVALISSHIIRKMLAASAEEF